MKAGRALGVLVSGGLVDGARRTTGDSISISGALAVDEVLTAMTSVRFCESRAKVRNLPALWAGIAINASSCPLTPRLLKTRPVSALVGAGAG